MKMKYKIKNVDIYHKLKHIISNWIVLKTANRWCSIRCAYTMQSTPHSKYFFMKNSYVAAKRKHLCNQTWLHNKIMACLRQQTAMIPAAGLRDVSRTWFRSNLIERSINTIAV